MASGDDWRVEYLLAEADRNIARQATRLDELRARASTLLTAAAVSAGFIGATALARHHNITFAGWVGVAGFTVAAMAATSVLWPRRGWVFTRNVKDLQSGLFDSTPAMTDREARLWLAESAGHDRKNNEEKLKWLDRGLFLACVAVIVEVLALLLDLRQ